MIDPLFTVNEFGTDVEVYQVDEGFAVRENEEHWFIASYEYTVQCWGSWTAVPDAPFIDKKELGL